MDDSNKSIDEIAAVFAECKDKELIEDFLYSLLTPNEINEVASRWALVKLITEGMSQRKISEKLGLSLCKITRGSKELKKENSSFKAMIDLHGEITKA
ncbi:MAG: Trp family transcriptional regulator [Spirochaetales bacterium]|nr:Trp family transcriptional regulator [Spirochaetales bacterium]